MSDFDRNAVAGRFGQTVGREDTAVVDQGLRAYMLHIYNYMALGLAITGFAALGIYMLSITGDASAAAKVLRGGAEIPAQIRAGMLSHPARLRALRQPAEMGRHSRAAGDGVRAELRHPAACARPWRRSCSGSLPR